MRLVPILALVGALALSAKTRKTPVGSAENEDATLTATVLSEAEIKEKLGSDLGGFYVVVEASVSPRSKPYSLRRDDFLLRTDRDGEKARPFSPTQIAGAAALVVSQVGGGGGVMADNNGPIWGGYPGGGRPRRAGGDGIGTSGESESRTKVVAGSKKRDKDNPLLAALSEKVLAEREIEGPAGGLLYFPMEPKQKLKDLELILTTPRGKLNLRFR